MKLLLITFLMSVLGYWSIFYEPALLKIRYENFSWDLEPMKVVFFADLHAGSPHINLKYIDRMIETINNEMPDLILIGGDLVTSTVIGTNSISFEDVTKRLSLIKSKYGIYVVLGNHDWWNDPKSIRELLIKSKIHILENESVVLSIGTHSKFNLIALGDDMTGHADHKNSFAKINRKLPKIVLLHDPGVLLDFTPQESFDLALAGHLHGGQVSFPFIGPLITPGRAPRHWGKGWTDTSYGKLFVTRGIGTSILPIRFNAPPEIVVVDFGKF